MKYLLDTCVLSEFVKPKPDSNLFLWLDKIEEHLLGVSVISLGEIQMGISRLAKGKRRTRLQEWLDQELMPRFVNRILPFSIDDSLLWGQWLGEAKTSGQPLPSVDTMLAAVARNRGLTLVTRNTRDFQRVEIEVTNPWIDS